MADDPNRDVLPVKECYCNPNRDVLPVKECCCNPNKATLKKLTNGPADVKDESYRPGVKAALQYKVKLNDQDLESRYISMCEETIQLRKICSGQEEKIKRLATKLLRIVNERNCTLRTVNKHNDRSAQRDENLQFRIDNLERDNQSLQDRVLVLRNQLTEHSRLHTSAHCPSAAVTHSPSSHRCRSANRLKHRHVTEPDCRGQCDGSPVAHRSEDSAKLRALVSVLEQDLEAVREQTTARIAELETELAANRASEQRTHTAENMELIRLKREVGRQSAQSEALAVKADAAEGDAVAARAALEELLAQTELLHKQMQLERDTNAQLRQQLDIVERSEPTVKDLEDQIRELKRENKTLNEYKESIHSMISHPRTSEYLSAELPPIAMGSATIPVAIHVVSPEMPPSAVRAPCDKEVTFQSCKKSAEQSDNIKKVPRREELVLPPERIPSLQQSLEVLLPPSEKKSGAIIPKQTQGLIPGQLLQAELAAELEKCRELLRVQLSLYNNTQIEVEKLTKRVSELEMEALKPKEKPGLERHRKSSWISVDNGEGMLEIHMLGVQLTPEGRDIIPENQQIFLSWMFFEQSLAQTVLKPGYNAEFNSSVVYKVKINDAFLEYISYESCMIHLHLTKPSGCGIVAQGTLGFSELLQFPQNKLHATVMLKCPDPDQPMRDITVGQLRCWYRLSCDVKRVNDYVARKGVSDGTPEKVNAVSFPGMVDTPFQRSEMLVDADTDDGSFQMNPSFEPLSYSSHQRTPAVPDADNDRYDDTNTEALSISSLQNRDKENSGISVIDILQESKDPEEKSFVTDMNVPEDSFKIEEMKPVAKSVSQDSAEPIVVQEPRLWQTSRDNVKDFYEEVRLPLDEQPGRRISLVPMVTKVTLLRPEPTDEVPSSAKVRLSSKPAIYQLIESNSSLPPLPEAKEELLSDMEKDILQGVKRLSDNESSISNRTELEMMEVLDEADWNTHVRKSSVLTESPSVYKRLEDPPMEAGPRIPSNLNSDRKSSLLKTVSSFDMIKHAQTITVRINSLTLDPESSTMRNSNITQLYVEYKFLGQSGADLETQSLPLELGRRLDFSYKYRFSYAEPAQRAMLMGMLNSQTWHQEVVQFIVISEPQEEAGKVKDCEEVGYVDVNMKVLLQSEKDMLAADLPIYSSDGFKEYIGVLNASIMGIAKCREALWEGQKPPE